MGTMNVKSWVEVFEASGIDKPAQHRWHAEFERRYPEGHQSFLEWLGLDAERIRKIRGDSGKATS